MPRQVQHIATARIADRYAGLFRFSPSHHTLLAALVASGRGGGSSSEGGDFGSSPSTAPADCHFAMPCFHTMSAGLSFPERTSSCNCACVTGPTFCLFL